MRKLAYMAVGAVLYTLSIAAVIGLIVGPFFGLIWFGAPAWVAGLVVAVLILMALGAHIGARQYEEDNRGS